MSIRELLYVSLIVYEWVVIARVLSTWLPDAEDYWLVRKLADLSDPYLSIFRGWIPLIAGTIDVSPIVALLLLNWVKNFLISS